MEEWKDVIGYESLYQASTHGRIRSLDRVIHQGNCDRFVKGKILSPGKNIYGYLRVNFCKNKRKKTYRVSRLVLTAFNRPPKDNEEGNHRDGNKSNNYLSNLEWMTHKENIWHKNNILGKHSKGENSGNAKLTEKDVREIKILLKEGILTQRQIAKMFKVNYRTINYIKLGKLWKHVSI